MGEDTASSPARGDGRLSVLLVEDHPLMVDGLVTRLQDKAGMFVCAVASNADQLKALYPKHRPDVVLCDVGLPGEVSGIEVTRHLLRDYPDAKILMYSGYADPAIAQTAIEAGAIGYLRKSTSVSNLVECLEAAAAGERDIFDRATAAALLRAGRESRDRSASVDKRLRDLTARQLEILVLMASTGTTETTQLAKRLHISEPTVRTHMTRMFHALGVNSRGAAIRLAYELDLVPRPAQPDRRA